MEQAIVNNKKTSCVAFLLFIGLVLFSFSWQTLEPTEYGLLFNSVTGRVDTTEPYKGGRHLAGPFKSFIVFPAISQVLEFSASPNAASPPLDVRTGRDEDDPDSGGQPLKLTLSLVYRLRMDRIGHIYKMFSMQYEQRYIQYVRQVLSEVCQRYQPSDFWLKRQKMSEDMLSSLRRVLASEGGCDIISLQFMRADFTQKYEDSVLSIQLAIQARTTTQYTKQVVQVQKQIDILETQADAEITVIDANAQATATLIRNNASAFGFNLTQSAKASSYKDLREGLSLDNKLLVEYLRVNSVRTHKGSRSVIAMESPFV